MSGGHAHFDVSIVDIVNLFGLEREMKSSTSDSFYVRCPLCGDEKFHMNINTQKNTYHCLLCSGDLKGTGVLDLYGRVKYGTAHIKGVNGGELKRKLLEDLGRGSCFYKRKNNGRTSTKPSIPGTSIASDDCLHQAFSKLLDISHFALSSEHKQNLLNRGLDLEAITQNQYRTIGDDFSWISNFPSLVKIYNKEKLYQEHRKLEGIKKYPSDKIIAGLIIAWAIQVSGIKVEGVPGFFKLGAHWCFKLVTGMLIPTRNSQGQIVALQIRKDKGKYRYLTISSKGLPYAVFERISRVHFPLSNPRLDRDSNVIITEGPLKADVSSHLMNEDVYLMALQGVNNTRELPDILPAIKSAGIATVIDGFDMDKTTNPNVAKAVRVIKKIMLNHGLKMPMRCWDEDYALLKYKELRGLCNVNDILVADKNNTFSSVLSMTLALDEKDVEHSVVISKNGIKEKNYWPSATKGLDDYLLSLSKSECKCG